MSSYALPNARQGSSTSLHPRRGRLNCSFCLFPLMLVAGIVRGGAQTPTAEIGNGILRATIYTPDPVKGYYRGTRFDWSGVIGSLQFSGHTYYGPWFTKSDPTVRDFVYRGSDIVAGPCSAVTGPAEEFLSSGEALGFSEALPGGTFLKIGVGVLRRPDGGKYDSFHLYEIVDPGKWSVKKRRDSVVFTQDVIDLSSSYGYRYRKVVRLIPGQPKMQIEHVLTNTGRRQIETSVYDHNFLVLDGQTTGPAFSVTVPFSIEPAKPARSAIGGIDGSRIFYRKDLEGHEGFAAELRGFGSTPKDYDITIENTEVGAGMKIIGDRPLESEELWSIRSVLAMEPYIHISIKPGQAFSWKYTYSYYLIP